MEKIKILFVIADMEGWGAQRVVLNLIKGLDRRRFQPVLVLSSKKGEFLKSLPEDVNVYDLGRRGILSFPMLVLRLAGVIRRERPQVVISALFHANVLSVLAGLIRPSGAKTVISEHIARISYRHCRHGALYRWFIKRLYPRADFIVAASEGVRGDIISALGVPLEKAVTIYNPLDVESIARLAAEDVDDMEMDKPHWIVNAGRLVEQKGHVGLLRAFSIVRRKLPAKLLILGDGEKREELEKAAKGLAVDGDVIFAGYRENPFKYMARSAVCVNASFYEGFGYVIVEAMASGAPVVATACPHGPEELIRDGIDGILVPVADEEALAKAIIAVLEDGGLRERLRAEGKKRAEGFSIREAVGRYERLFEMAAKS